jgi:pyrroline-5-carboxylate reductase
MEASTLRDSRIAFIGAGNMAEALVKGMVNSEIIPSDHIHVSDIDAEKLSALRANYSVETDSENSIAAKGAGICIFAVKPQVLPEVLADTVAGLEHNALVVSIAAGIPTARIESILPKGQRVVRVMPNTPALIGMGISAICRGINATESDMDLTEILMGTVGRTVRVSESEMDAVTALSGSGPAYQFFLLESMISAGVEMGLPKKTARELACATAEGATRLMLESGADAGELRAKVTSKGGTTAAAIEVMESNRMDATIIAALKAARDRSIELAEQ